MDAWQMLGHIGFTLLPLTAAYVFAYSNFGVTILNLLYTLLKT